jgi:hypothetical protein
MERISLTPGRLYARLSAEFQMLRSRSCSTCNMPLPEMVEPNDDEANWTVGPVPAVCEHCRPVVDEVARRTAFFYDIHDPMTADFRRTRFDARPGSD